MKNVITILMLFYGFMLSAQSNKNSVENSQNGKVSYGPNSVIQPGAVVNPENFNLSVNAVADLQCTVNGIGITSTGSTSAGYSTPTSGVVCSPFAGGYTGTSVWTGLSSTGFITYTFTSPVNNARVTYSSVNGLVDVGTINVNGGGLVSLSNACGANISGNVLTCNFPTSGQYGDIAVTVSSTVPFTTITLVNTGGNSGFVGGNPCNFTFGRCLAGTTAPVFRTRTLSNRCPETTANLNSLPVASQPFGTTLTWHTGTPATNANTVSNPGAVGPGTYYAAFYDAVGNCYSPTTPILVTITECVADLQITKIVDVRTASVGSNVTFTITATNNGPSPATGVTVTDVLPVGYTFVSATPSVGTWFAPTWTINNLGVGASATLTIVATVIPRGGYANTATITGNQTDPDLTNNTATATIRVLIPLDRVDAVNDDFRRTPISICGGTTPSVFSNDTVNGFSFLPSAVNVSLVLPLSIPGATIDANGVITIPPGTAPGGYTLTYNLCSNSSLFCDTADVSIFVDTIFVAAFNDNFLSTPISSITGGQTPSVLTNDTYYSGITVSLAFSPIPGATIDQAGVITIPAGVAAGNYTFLYQLTDCRGNVYQAKADVAISRRIIVGPIDPIDPFEPLELKQVKIYPNPSNGNFTIDATGFENLTVSIYTSMGRNVYQLNDLKDQTKVDLSNLPKGIYFVTLTNGSESIQKKVVID